MGDYSWETNYFIFTRKHIILRYNVHLSNIIVPGKHIHVHVSKLPELQRLAFGDMFLSISYSIIHSTYSVTTLNWWQIVIFTLNYIPPASVTEHYQFISYIRNTTAYLMQDNSYRQISQWQLNWEMLYNSFAFFRM